MLELVDYSLRILPGLGLIVFLYALLRGKQAIALRILLLILAFILIRDTMTPVGFWQFGTVDTFVPWVRFVNDPLIVGALGLLSLTLTIFVVKFNTQMKPYLRWDKLTPRTILYGLLGAGIIVLPFVIAYQFIPIDERGGNVALSLLPFLLIMALFGNLLEEVLFRGYLQGYLEKLYSPVRAAIISAFMFAAGHAFLATSVTDLGFMILVFTLYEGLVCAFLRMRLGIWPAAIAHGMGIFILACGLV